MSMKSRKILMIVISVVVVALIVLVGLNLRSAIRYNYAQNLLSAGKFEQSGEAFAALGGYEESSKLSMYSRACAAAENGEFYTASQAFGSLGDYKDCRLLADYYEARESEAAGEYYPKSYLSAIRTFSTIPLFRDSQEHIAICQGKAYDAACEAGDREDYVLAMSLLDNIGYYQDCKRLSSYYSACNDLKNGNLKEALQGFEKLTGYKDSEQMLEKVRQETYKAAESYLKQEKYAAAYDLFETLGDYSDAADRIKASKYERAEKHLQAEEYNKAYELFEEISDYSDSAERILQSKYERAEKLLKAEQYDAAYEMFNEIPEYKDAAERIQKSKYERAVACMNNYDFDGAEKLFGELGNYSDAAEQLNSITTAKLQKQAEDFKAAGRYQEAREIFLQLQDEHNADECRYLYAQSIEAKEPWKAYKEFTELGDYQDSAERAKSLYPRRFEEIGEEDGNGLRIYRDPTAGYGLLDKNADVAVEPQYIAIQNGQKGNYMVLKDNKAGVIKPDGSVLVDLDYSGISLVDNDRYSVKKDDKYGIVDADGNTVIECLYDSIILNEDGQYNVKGSTGNGILKTDGTTLIPAEYDQIERIENGYFVIKDNKQGLLKEDGTTFIPAKYDRITYTENGYLVTNDGKKGLLKEDGSEFIAPIYDEIEIREDGKVQVKDNGMSGLLSADGGTIIEPQYDRIEQMNDGRYRVTAFGKQGVLDADGTIVIKPTYQSIKLENTGNYTVTLNNRSGIVSYEGKVLHEPDMEEIRGGSNDGKYLIFRQDGLYGFMKADTFEVNVPAEWKEVHIMYNGYAYIRNNLDKWGVIDATGKVTVTPQWAKIDYYDDCGHALNEKKLLNNQGKLVCDFYEYNKSSYKKINYLGNGVFADGSDDECIYDANKGKIYSFEIEGYNVIKLKLYNNGLLTGYIPYKKSSSYSRTWAYGVIDAAKTEILSDNRWEEISSVPGKARIKNKYGWIGKDGKDLIDAKYDYIRNRAENGKVIAADYNDRGNLVYVLIDDTTGKILQTDITSEEEAVKLSK